MVEELQIPDWLAKRLERPVAVFGAGSSGLAARDLANALGAEAVVFDERAKGDYDRRFDRDAAGQFGLAITSPGFPEDHPWLIAAREGGCEVIAEFDFGALLWKGPIIAVTGTNGKTTLTEFLEKAFVSSGTEAFAVGNLGRPLSEVLAKGLNPEAIAVAEVSSFQAAEIRYMKPDYVLWSNFDEDHLDRHGNLKRYFAAKYRLVEQAGQENVFYGGSVRRFAESEGFALDEAGFVGNHACSEVLGLKGTDFDSMPELKNYLKARALWLRMGFPEDELIEAAHNFRKSPHRMELVRNLNGVSFWDDSKATNFHATLGGLARFAEPVLWIGGGKGKGGDLERFCERLFTQVSEAHLIGETRSELRALLESRGVKTELHDGLEAAVERAFENTNPGDNVLLSPGFASFDMFDGYKHRGEIFRKVVNAL
ncbi:MAG: UDP-N-acetylmuramoyl-L-alanine--D-glutamate ligase [Verrucomicrobiota bacterium]